MLECLEETRTICISFKTVSYNSLCAVCTLSELSNWKRYLFLILGHHFFSYSFYLWPQNYAPISDILRIVSENTGCAAWAWWGKLLCHASPEVLRLETSSFLSANILPGKGIRCNCFGFVLKKGRAQKKGKVCICVLQEERLHDSSVGQVPC